MGFRVWLAEETSLVSSPPVPPKHTKLVVGLRKEREQMRNRPKAVQSTAAAAGLWYQGEGEIHWSLSCQECLWEKPTTSISSCKTDGVFWFIL